MLMLADTVLGFWVLNLMLQLQIQKPFCRLCLSFTSQIRNAIQITEKGKIQ